MYLYKPRSTTPPKSFHLYGLVVRAVCALCLLTTFWPVLRILGLTLFDALAPLAVICGLIYLPKERGPSLGALSLALAGIGLLAFAGVISYPSSNDPMQHLQKIAYLIIALGGIIGVSYVLVNRKIFTTNEALFLLCASATCSSLMAILQGRFHMFMGIIPYITRMESSTRMTGLCEHPIETGITAAFGAVIGFGLAMHTRKWLVYLPLVALNALSMIYSASLTAVLAMLMGGFAYCIYTKAYRALVVTSMIGVVLVGGALSYTGLGLLTSRLEALVHSKGNYATLQARELQWSQALELVEPATLAVGNGYSSADLPQGKEIHNGLVASLFHFGLLGLASQLFMFAFFGVRMSFDQPRDIKAILLACIVIFTLSYMTGPALSRRSLWVPLIVLGAYLSAPRTVARMVTRIEPGKFSANISSGV